MALSSLPELEFYFNDTIYSWKKTAERTNNTRGHFSILISQSGQWYRFSVTREVTQIFSVS